MSRLTDAIEKYGKIVKIIQVETINPDYQQWKSVFVQVPIHIPRKILKKKEVAIRKGLAIKTIESFAKYDPSGNHKYLDWMLKTKTTTKILPQQIKDFISLFHKSPQKFKYQDLNKYKTEEEILNDYNKAVSKLSKNEMKNIGAVVIKETPQYKIIRVLTSPAAKMYGSETKWCITNAIHFNDYKTDWLVYYFIVKDEKILNCSFNGDRLNYSKFAMICSKRVPNRVRFYIANDNEVTKGNIERNYKVPGILNPIFEDYKKELNFSQQIDATTRLKKTMIKYKGSKENLDLLEQIIKNLNEMRA